MRDNPTLRVAEMWVFSLESKIFTKISNTRKRFYIEAIPVLHRFYNSKLREYALKSLLYFGCSCCETMIYFEILVKIHELQTAISLGSRGQISWNLLSECRKSKSFHSTGFKQLLSALFRYDKLSRVNFSKSEIWLKIPCVYCEFFRHDPCWISNLCPVS